MGEKLLEQVFNLKFMAKQLNRSAIKCEKDEKSERLKVKKAIEKGNVEGAKIYAQNAIRKKHEQLNYLKLASRLDAVVSRLDTQAKMQMVTKNMMAITKNLEKALASNNLEKVSSSAVACLLDVQACMHCNDSRTGIRLPAVSYTCSNSWRFWTPPCSWSDHFPAAYPVPDETCSWTCIKNIDRHPVLDETPLLNFIESIDSLCLNR